VSGSIFSSGFQLPVITYRQGGSSTVFGTPGTTNFSLSGVQYITQTGVVTIVCSSVPQYGSLSVNITFPTSFTQIPIILCNTMNANAGGVERFSVACTTTSTGASIFVANNLNGTLTTNLNVGWIAIGV